MAQGEGGKGTMKVMIEIRKEVKAKVSESSLDTWNARFVKGDHLSPPVAGYSPEMAISNLTRTLTPFGGHLVFEEYYLTEEG